MSPVLALLLALLVILVIAGGFFVSHIVWIALIVVLLVFALAVW